jgi:acetyl-CoA carboxylase carboxyl transferase subunit alpha
MRSYLDFEKPIAELEAKLEELRALETGDSAAAIGEEISRLGRRRKSRAIPSVPTAWTMSPP